MTTISEVKCPDCGKTGLTETRTIIDRRTGEAAMGRGPLIFGIVIAALAAFFLVLIIAYWNDSVNELREYWSVPIILLIGGGPILYKRLREDRDEQMLYKCASCGRTFGKDDLVRASSSIFSSS